MSAGEIERKIEYYKENIKELELKLNSTNRYRHEKNGVCCFTKADNLNDILMWSHYANSHKGVCLGFEDDIKPIPVEKIQNDVMIGSAGLAKDVIYRPDYPVTDPFDIKKFVARDLLLTKFSTWGYEKELRMISPVKGLYQFEKANLKEIVFGLRIDSTHKEVIRRVVSKDKELKHVKFFDIQLYKTRFRLKREECK